MSGDPAPIPPSSADRLSAGGPRLRGPIQLGLLTTDLDAESVFAKLQLAIARSSAERDVILGAIAEAAQALTNASGAALAIQCDGAIICRARSGETAPDLGARLSVDSGISGECLRTGQILRCDDTEKDVLVDPEVCRWLGLRSIAVLPLRGRYGPTGILEAFSTRAYAFEDEHMRYLVRLAALAEAAQERGVRGEKPSVKPVDPKAIKVQARGTLSTPAAGSDNLVHAKDAFAGHARRAFAGRQRWAAGAGILGLLLISVLVWREWHAPSSEAAPGSQPAQSAATVLVSKPSPIRSGARSSGLEASGGGQHSTRIEITDLSTDTNNPDLAIPDRSSSPAEKPPVATDGRGGLRQPSQIPTPGSDTAAIGSLPVASAAPSQLGLPTSQDISGAVLQYKVQPVYPQEALLRKMQGRVVVQATITEDGKVEGVTVMSGNAILARAAADAIQQWQYRPALLNGKPIRTQKQIAVTFAAP